MASCGTFQKIHPLSLLAQLSGCYANGCLQVSSGSVSWSVYLEQGKLTYASNSVDPFDRLDRHLHRLGYQVPTLGKATRAQVRLLFENATESQSFQNSDYRAICWLVSQQHINSAQAANLVEGLIKEVIESFLLVREGSYELIGHHHLEGTTKFCMLEMRPLLEHCQKQLLAARPVAEPQNAGQQQTQTETLQKPDAQKSVLMRSATAVASTATPVARTQTPTAPKSTYTIACVDDSRTMLNEISRFLDDKTFSVFTINDPVKALMQILRIKPDLILLDVSMPTVDGYDLCNLLRKHPVFRNIPIVMVTGNTGIIDRAKAKFVGASGYLTKPFTQADLVKMVFKHLG